MRSSCFFFITLICVVNASSRSPTMAGLARIHGYDFQSHSVTTNDGYILTIGRLPVKIHCRAVAGTAVIGHGFLNNGELYLVSPSSLAYRFSDNCFDVWIMNSRGTRYSKHVNYTKDDKEFWNYSQDDMALNDVRKIIDYVINISTARKFHYIGYSQTTTQFLILMAEEASYQKYIESAHLMAPVAFMTSVTHPMIANYKLFLKFAQTMELANIPLFAPDRILTEVFLELCNMSSPLCSLITGSDCDQDDDLLWSRQFPDSGCFRAVLIYGQWKYYTPRLYDYGPTRNLELYHTINPPALNFSTINVPIYLYCNSYDPYALCKEASVLKSILPDARVLHEVNSTHHGHGDCLTHREKGLETLDSEIITNINKLPYEKWTRAFKCHGKLTLVMVGGEKNIYGSVIFKNDLSGKHIMFVYFLLMYRSSADRNRLQKLFKHRPMNLGF